MTNTTETRRKGNAPLATPSKKSAAKQASNLLSTYMLCAEAQRYLDKRAAASKAAWERLRKDGYKPRPFPPNMGNCISWVKSEGEQQ